jgi:hypothetical protein
MKARSTLKGKRRTLLSIAACGILLGFWLFSYFSYGIASYEAYAGVGTELASVRGLVVFYHFDSYTRGRPPQYWSIGFLSPTSRNGGRLRDDFDFWNSSSTWNHLGFSALWIDKGISEQTETRLLSIPYWFLFCMQSLTSYLLHRKKRRTRLQSAEIPN